MERRSTAARRRRATAARNAERTRQALRSVQETAKSLTAQLESAWDAVLAARNQTHAVAEVPVGVAQDSSGMGDESSSIATLEPPLLPPLLEPEDDYAPTPWTDTWTNPEADAEDDPSWRWQEPSFDDEISEVLIARPRRSPRMGFMRALPFSLRERTWSGMSAWRRHLGLLITLAVVCLLAAVGGVIGYQQIVKATANSDLSLSSQNGSATPNGVVIAPQMTLSTTPTPAIPAYQIGTWVSNTSPTGGTVTVYARVVQNMQAASGISVSVLVQSPGFTKTYGPTRTGSDGIVKFTVHYGAASGADPVFVTATAHINGQSLSAQTTFVPLSGTTKSSATPPSDGNPTPGPTKHHHH